MWNREPINVIAKDHGYFPKSFLWRGRAHEVDAVVQCWSVTQDDWMQKVLKHCFRVRTDDTTYVVSHDLKRNTWYVEKP